MNKETKTYSSCCGAEANGHDIDYGICPECKEYCTFETEDNEIKEHKHSCPLCDGSAI